VLTPPAASDGVVYVATIREAERLHEHFSQLFPVGLYHGKMPAAERKDTQNRFMADEFKAIIATNARYGTPDWTPIVLINENVDADLLAGVYRAADMCIVSSLQDGMNLVAKEFVACQIDERGVLILSRFTGSAEEIDGAILINPFNVDGFVAAIRTALEMSPEERKRHMHRMRRQLNNSTIFDWLGSILGRATEPIPEISAPFSSIEPMPISTRS
jgi:trehalose-6-phosphate synthase